MKTILFLKRLYLRSVVLITFLFILSTASCEHCVDDFKVTNLNDSGEGSLRAAIELANVTTGHDEITFDKVLMGTISLTSGEMAITGNLTITGPGADVITIDAQGNSRIFNVDDSFDDKDKVVSIIGLKFINGSSDSGNGGGAILNKEKLSIDSCVFESNSAIVGGTIFNHNFGIIEEITNSTFNGNSGTYSGAIDNWGNILNISTSTFSGNSTTNNGSAISNNSSGTIEKIANSTFSENSATRNGGAIWNRGTIEEIFNSRFRDNSATLNGGAILNRGTIEKITYSNFSNNSGDSPSISTGGAIHNEGGTIGKINNCSFAYNRANRGGAIFNRILSIIGEITNCTFINNKSIYGSAIYNQGNILNISNSAFSENGSAAAAEGGAIWNQGPLNISFTTIVNNQASAGGGIFESGASISIRNSIVAFNTANLGANCNIDIAAGGDETNNYSNDNSCGFGNGDNSTILLGPFFYNGGQRIQNTALLGGDPLDGASPNCDAINDIGVPVSNDIRGFARPAGALCDAGAYESGN